MAYVKSPINVDRADWAEAALEAFAFVTRRVPVDLSDKEEREEVIQDLLCDLLHYAQQNGHDPIAMAFSEMRGFQAESTGEV
jgi:hypothetical protein